MVDATEKPVTVLEPVRRSASAHLTDLFNYGPLYRFMFREITMRRVRNTHLGVWWLVIRPAIPAVMTIFTFTYVVVDMKSYGLPYPVFYLSGFLVWTFFKATVAIVPRSLLMMRSVMKRSYFPRILVPLAGFGPALIELAMTVVMFAAALTIFGFKTHILFLRTDAYILLFPVCLLLALMMAMAIGIVSAVMALFVRDVVFTVPYMISILLFLTPVIYPVTFIPPGIRGLYYVLNPMAKVIETSRWSLTSQGLFEPMWFAISAGMIVLFFAAAVWFFARIESIMADAL